ncbi:TetR/AcrR family transcriptional regulator [Paenibacillus soyae]|uniref:TetR/AcrR family transcriptional regulator n=1 Tax=Paenibacillus soyae TaxID=2969249 RepID=A0A9X2MRK5_9BACL|nr:TetR/AcrR family transcriptional regulator [Paenibacillus soyae]MCR2805571.1 TetR/AcrR family transcriptional regulator [Paenibacillus soyae]
MGEIRNAERTRKNILKAALKEFIEKGYTGARIEYIASQANVKRQLFYHYFKNKDELLEAVIQNMRDEEPKWTAYAPSDPVHIAEHRFQVNCQARLDFLKFTAWEALEDRPGQIARRKVRAEALQGYVDDLKAKKEAGLVPVELEPELLTLAITALTAYPIIFSDVTKMVTGNDPTDPEFQTKWSTFLTKISARIFKNM